MLTMRKIFNKASLVLSLNNKTEEEKVLFREMQQDRLTEGISRVLWEV